MQHLREIARFWVAISPEYHPAGGGRPTYGLGTGLGKVRGLLAPRATDAVREAVRMTGQP
jgi:hypothetical protein